MFSSSLNTSRHKADVLLVTVTAVETKTVLDVYQERTQQTPGRVFIGDKAYFDLGVMGSARVFLARSEQGAVGLGASLQTVTSGIAALKPAYVVMVGIAFGIASPQQERQIGDILVARQLSFYEQQRVGRTPDGSTDLRMRGERVAASPELIDRLWTGHLDWTGAAIHFGLMLSGEKLIDHPDFLSQLLTFEPEAIGGEMEGAGLYAAAQQLRTAWILVKAISDWANGEKNRNKQEYQARAARNAAEFVLHVLAQGGFAKAADHLKAPGTELRQLLSERLSLGDLRTRCFDLGIDYDDVRGDAKAAKIIELIQYLGRRQRLHDLENWLRTHRGDIDLADPRW